MQTITSQYLSRAELWLFATTLFYFLMNGAQIFETAVLVPKWTAHPPESFQYFQGKYGLDLKTFWVAIHSIHETTFIIAIFFCWKLEIRNWLLLLFLIHFAVRIWTMAYFAPNIIEFQQIANGKFINTDLIHRTLQWRKLNYVRVGIFLAVSIGLIPLLWKVLHMRSI